MYFAYLADPNKSYINKVFGPAQMKTWSPSPHVTWLTFSEPVFKNSSLDVISKMCHTYSDRPFVIVDENNRPIKAIGLPDEQEPVYETVDGEGRNGSAVDSVGQGAAVPLYSGGITATISDVDGSAHLFYRGVDLGVLNFEQTERLLSAIITGGDGR